jgi:HlyD family secretion protein
MAERTAGAGAWAAEASRSALLALLAALLTAAGCARSDAGADLPAVSAAAARDHHVSALGRLEPEDGIRRLAGPSGAAAVIAELRVDEGDPVQPGQVVAALDTVPIWQASIRRLEAELANARSELQRHRELNSSAVVSDSQREQWETRVRVVEAELAQARAELDRAYVRSPLEGRVLRVHAREGELVGPEGIVELGRTQSMFAIAEVYEDDVGRVRIGQRARVTSPAFEEALGGTVDWIHLKVAKQDALGTDPAARKDARVVEVEIRLDESEAAATLTNLQVEVEIEP